MKKNMSVLIFIIILALALFFYIDIKNKDRVDLKIMYVDEINEENKEHMIVYALDNYNNIIPVDLTLEEVNINKYIYVFDIYNIKRNTLPINSSVPSKNILEIDEYKVENNIINFTLKKSNIEESELNTLIFLMYLSYRDLGITEVIVNINNKIYDSSHLNFLK